MLTYDVDIWSIRQRKGRPKPYELRWRVGERPHSRSFTVRFRFYAKILRGQQDRANALIEQGLSGG